MAGPLHWSLLTGWLPATLLGLAVLAGAVLVVRTNRRWLTVVLPSVGVGSILCAWFVDWAVDNWWRPFPDPLPLDAVVWIGLVLAAVALAVVQVIACKWPRKLLACTAAVAVLAAGSNEINRSFDYYPNLSAVLGLVPGEKHDLPPRQPGAHHPHAGSSISRWRPSGAVPQVGQVSEVNVPGTRSGVVGRSAWVYLPPAYLTANRPLLPVLELIGGQPGKPVDWINSGRIASVMDTFAARHHGLAPVIVMPDPLGGALSNPMCLDSRLGNDDTYLSIDVPDWIRTHLQVEPDARYWAVGGFSYGGTCALQFAVKHPRIFPTFLDITGQPAPTLGSRQRTIDQAFGGDAAAYRRVNPLDVLAAAKKAERVTRTSGPFMHSAGIVVAAAQDKVYGPLEPVVVAACNGARLKVSLLELPGGHRWSLATSAVEQTLPWLTSRLGLSLSRQQATAPATPLRPRSARGRPREAVPPS